MEIIRLEDNLDYVILDTIEINNIKYVYLSLLTENQKKEVCIRKISGDYLVGLDSKFEFENALNAYAEKYK